MGTASTVARLWVRGRRQDGWTSRRCYKACSFDYVDAWGSHVEKKEKTVFVKGVEGEDKGATSGGLNANLGTLG